MNSSPENLEDRDKGAPARQDHTLKSLIQQVRGLERMRAATVERRDAAARTAIAMENAIENNLKKIRDRLAPDRAHIVDLPGDASAVIVPPIGPGDVMAVEIYVDGLLEQTFGI